MPQDSPKLIRSLDSPEITERHIVFAAEQIAQRLRSLSISSGPSALAQQFYTRIRAKTPESIRGKIERKRREALLLSRDIERAKAAGRSTYTEDQIAENARALRYSLRQVLPGTDQSENVVNGV